MVTLTVSLTACGGPAGTQPPSASPPSTDSEALTIAGEDQEALAELVARFLGLTDPAAPLPIRTALHAGVLPDDLPVDLPIPAGASVVGGISLESADARIIEVLLDTRQDPQALIDFYVTQMESRGFVTLELPKDTGFVQPRFLQDFCQDNDLYVHVSAQERADQTTEARIRIADSVEDTVCDPSFLSSPFYRHGPLPTLEPPPGAVSRRDGSGVEDGGSAWRSVTLQTELGVADLAGHYAEQLEAQGWERLPDQPGGQISWSTWATTDENGTKWVGMLVLTATPGSSEGRFALFRVDPQP